MHVCFIILLLGNEIFLFQLQSCKANLLIFLSGFIQKVGKKVLPYAVDIKVMTRVKYGGS